MVEAGVDRELERVVDLILEKQQMATYEQVYFAQGEEADEILAILRDDGPDAAMSFAQDWHYPGEHMTREGEGWGTSDDTYKKEGYVLSWNEVIGYVGLVYEVEDEDDDDDDDEVENHPSEEGHELIRTWEDPDGYGFKLEMFDTGRTDSRGQTYIAYHFHHNDELIFEGEEFAGSPMHADDSLDTVGALLGFLSLRSGDTDEDYFEDYTEEQIAWRDEFAETLSVYPAMIEERDWFDGPYEKGGAVIVDDDDDDENENAALSKDDKLEILAAKFIISRDAGQATDALRFQALAKKMSPRGWRDAFLQLDPKDIRSAGRILGAHPMDVLMRPSLGGLG